MSSRWLGFGITGLGVILVVVGVLQLGGGDETPVAAETTTTSLAPTSTTQSTTTTTEGSTMTTEGSTTTSSSTTTTLGTTTTTVPAPTVEDFVDQFRAAIAAGDTDFLFNRLHPVVLATYDTDVCRSYIDREILSLVDYKVTGPIRGPFVRTYATNDGNVTVNQAYDAPVSFTFQGQSFNATGGFAIENGQVYWFSQCR